jgi:hypothetical protein
MKNIVTLLLCSATACMLSAQVVKTAEQLELANKGLYIGASTTFYVRGGMADPTDIVSRSLFDVQYRFANQFSAGLSFGFDYEKTNSILNYTLTRLSVLPELRYWPHKEPQRLMPYLFINYGFARENQNTLGNLQTNSLGFGTAGAGCTGWINRHLGLQLRADILTFRKDEFSLTAQPFWSMRIGVVFKTNQ